MGSLCNNGDVGIIPEVRELIMRWKAIFNLRDAPDSPR